MTMGEADTVTSNDPRMSDICAGRNANRVGFEAILKTPGLVRGGRIAANWLSEGRFWFIDDDKTLVFDPATRSIGSLFDVEAISNAFSAVIGLPATAVELSPETFITLPNGDMEFDFGGRRYRYLATTSTIELLPGGDMAERYFGLDLSHRSGPRLMTRPNHLARSAQPCRGPLRFAEGWRYLHSRYRGRSLR
jgi:dipeptidyl-peptidase 4